MRRIDELFTAWPFLGSRRMTAMLQAEGHAVNRKRTRRLMRKMDIAVLGPKPRTNKPPAGHKIFPFLLRGLAIERANQVWCADITYAVLAWRLTVWREGTTGPLGDKAVDMMDNARTLPTCPQRQQRQQPFAMVG
jgi:transposase InsO family protein